ncbi:hypothetical protein AQJ11_15180 [Streptomyces corchorusii]|uniref:Uncharacterized protein n=1 Tax=Streptomyces corchorusii TaxID=1903 RepID=A0A101QDL5_STRCK|nr:hypothetical protein AQJ11_15180 [Streptomyces corchorusii]
MDAPEWDAVRVPRQLGLSPMEILGTRAGAVIEDPTRGGALLLHPGGRRRQGRMTTATQRLAVLSLRHSQMCEQCVDDSDLCTIGLGPTRATWEAPPSSLSVPGT